MIKYYGVRLIAALFVMGSIGGGFFANAEYGKWIGWSIFVILMAVGILLHVFADKMKKPK